MFYRFNLLFVEVLVIYQKLMLPQYLMVEIIHNSLHQ